MIRLTLADCRPEVLAFALLMEQELRANDHKPGWKDDRPLDLAWRVREEAQELYNVVWDATRFVTPLDAERLAATPRDGLKSLRQRIASEAADAGNMAMMVADTCGALPPVYTATTLALAVGQEALRLFADELWKRGVCEAVITQAIEAAAHRAEAPAPEVTS